MASQAVRLRIVFITLSLMNVDDLSEKMLPWDPKTFGKKEETIELEFWNVAGVAIFWREAKA